MLGRFIMKYWKARNTRQMSLKRVIVLKANKTYKIKWTAACSSTKPTGLVMKVWNEKRVSYVHTSWVDMNDLGNRKWTLCCYTRFFQNKELYPLQYTSLTMYVNEESVGQPLNLEHTERKVLIFRVFPLPSLSTETLKSV